MSDPIITRKFGARSSWREISDAINEGNEGFLSEDDTISFELKDGTKVSAVAVAFNLYGENTVLFAMREMLPELWRMNDRDTTEGLYLNSELCRHLQEDVVPQFPDDLVDVIKTRRIHQRANGMDYISDELIFPFSAKEIFGANVPSDIGDIQIPYFQKRINRIRALEGDPYYWWLRSADTGSNFYNVTTSGISNYYGASTVFGVVFGFCM